MTLYLNIIQIIVSLALVALVILQGRGGSMSGLFGGGGSIYRTRRGVEKTIFNLTIALAVIFFIISLVSVLVA